MQNIKFIGAPRRLFNKEMVSSMLVHFATQEGFKIDTLEYNFVGLEKMYGLNKEYLNHTTDTDIITFDYSANNLIAAEVYISMKMMEINAETNSQTTDKEAVRLVSHALFHCLGYKDKSAKEKKIMRNKEEEFLFAVSRETRQDV